MPHPLEESVLRILDSAGITVGAGFLVAPGLAVTCAHVVSAAQGGPEKTIQVQPFTSTGNLTTTVLHTGWSPADKDDLALLRLENDGNNLVPVALSSAQDRLGRPFAVLGFPPDKDYTADWSQGLLSGIVSSNISGRSDLLQFQGAEIRPGMSGGPVLDTHSAQVVGMVVEYKDRDGVRRAYAVTADTIRAVCPQPLPLEAPRLEDDLETLLRQLISALKESQASIQVGGDAGGSGATCLVAGSGNVVCLSPSDIQRLNALRPDADPARREELYLARFILNTFYSRWDREYVPLAGTLTNATVPGMRLHHKADPSIGSGGISIPDIREAILGRDKTRLVILGDPGAGKSTTLDRLALDLARRRLADPLNQKLPFRVNLFEFSDASIDADAFLQRKWNLSTGLGLDYAEAINNRQVCFLLDGLNQMPFADRQDRFDSWTAWVQGLPAGNWAIFTCRSADFQSSLGLPEVWVQSLDQPRIMQVLQIRFGGEKAAEKWLDFETLLRGADDRFEKLLGNPLMLSLLIRRAAADQPLSANRAELMRGLVEDRLRHELRDRRHPESVRSEPATTTARVLTLLERLAYAMQDRRGEGTDFTSDLARQALSPFDPNWSDLLALAGCAGLVLPAFDPEVDARYSFAHQLMQEYFAAGQLLREFFAGADLSSRWRVNTRVWHQGLLPKRYGKDQAVPNPPTTGWEETTRMAAARMPQAEVLALVHSVATHNLPLASMCLAEARGVDYTWTSTALAQTADRLRVDLLTRQRAPRFTLQSRIAAGLALGDLGHPDLLPQPFEFEDQSLWVILPKLDPVPAGSFLFGSDFKDQSAYDDEKTPQRRLDLPAFTIGRYPVTNAEYRFFIAANGYEDPRWWCEEGWRWRQGGSEAHQGSIEDWLDYRNRLAGYGVEKLARGRSWHSSTLHYWQRVCALSDEDALLEARQQFDRPFDRPAFWDDPHRSAPARPVVGVNWYEAAAYARWFSAVTGAEYRLPEELEWEKAARGSDDRVYSWGNRWASSCCNTIESHIYAATPVGLFAGGRSPFGLFDAAGNAWEWTSSWYQPYPSSSLDSDEYGEKYRVVRGGSWYSERGYTRCASRYRYGPDNFYDTVGFRLLSPGAF